MRSLVAQLTILALLALPSAAAASPSPGLPWGPCVAGQCDEGSFCVESKAGNVCAPWCSTTACTQVQTACDQLIGDGTATCLDSGLCINECDADGDCAPGQMCSADGACVWPVLEPSGTWAPCSGLCEGGFCIESDAGSVCLPPCSAEGCKAPTDSCGDEVPVQCAPTGACEVPCDDLGGCWGAMMVCDVVASLCVFP